MALTKTANKEVTDLVEVQFEAGTLNVLYRPAMITQAMIREAQANGNADAILPCLVDWDFYDVPPTVDEATGQVLDAGVKMPLSADSLEELGLPNAMVMVGCIVDRELGKVGKATGRPIGLKK